MIDFEEQKEDWIMKMRLFGILFMAALLVGGVAAPGHASFAQGDLIRIVYDSATGVEEGTDLGTLTGYTNTTENTTTYILNSGVQTLGSGSNAVQLGDFGAGQSWSNLTVAYFAYNGSNVQLGTSFAAVSATASSLTNSAGAYNGFKTAAANVQANFNSLGSGALKATAPMAGTGSNLVSYWNNMDSGGITIGAVGTFNGWLPTGASNNAYGSEIVPVANGSVNQSLYMWYGSTGAGLNGAQAAAFEGALQTVTGASGLYTVYDPVPLPPSALLMLPGLLGLIGLRRKLS
jgi:hypothetical protein